MVKGQASVIEHAGEYVHVGKETERAVRSLLKKSPEKEVLVVEQIAGEHMV